MWWSTSNLYVVCSSFFLPVLLKLLLNSMTIIGLKFYLLTPFTCFLTHFKSRLLIKRAMSRLIGLQEQIMDLGAKFVNAVFFTRLRTLKLFLFNNSHLYSRLRFCNVRYWTNNASQVNTLTMFDIDCQWQKRKLVRTKIFRLEPNSVLVRVF